MSRIYPLFLLSLCLLIGCEKDKKAKPESAFSNDPLFKEVIGLIQEKYVNEPDLEKMRLGALGGMLSALDNYSAYLPVESYEALAASTGGEFGGIGVEVYPVDGGIKVITAIDETPAAKAGIQAGDLITAIDHKPTYNMTYSEIIEALHGAPHTFLTVTVQRDEVEINFQIERNTVVINPVRLIIKEDIAYLRISYFNDKVADGLKQAWESINKSKDNITGIVLDLRNNPGGVLDQAVKTVGYFIKSGIVTKITDRQQKIKPIEVQLQETFPNVPVVVLINNGSASASEIVAAALKYHERAVIVGKRSHGKGSIQSVFPLPGNGGIKLTTARFLTPSGEELNGKGVQPDITVDVPAAITTISLLSEKGINDGDTQLMRAFEILKSLASIKRWQS